MSARKAMNAKCWDCKFYLVLNGVCVCCATAKNIPMTMLPMKCKMFEKGVANARKS